MPTIPTAALANAPEPHRHRQMAESFGVDAERYDRTRPRYPEGLIQRIVDASPGADIVDVGCGTGIEARQFVGAGCRVLGVEPDERMAQFARGTGLGVEVAAFEAWSPAGRRFDAVVAGTAWHWVDPVAGAAKAAQVLRPGGLLAPFWHVFDPPPRIADVSAEVFRRVAPDSPVNLARSGSMIDAYQALLDKAADGIRRSAGFDEPERWRYDWEHTYTRDEWLDQLPTTGALTQLPPDALAQVLDAVGAEIDAMGGSFTMTYATMAVAAVRR